MWCVTCSSARCFLVVLTALHQEEEDAFFDLDCPLSAEDRVVLPAAHALLALVANLLAGLCAVMQEGDESIDDGDPAAVAGHIAWCDAVLERCKRLGQLCDEVGAGVLPEQDFEALVAFATEAHGEV